MKVSTILFYTLVSLAVFGLGFTLFTDPGSILRMILLYAAIAGVIYLIYRIWASRKPNRREQLAFKKAAKQSKKRYATATPSKVRNMKTPVKAKAKPKSPAPLRKSASHRMDGPKLTVIEGKKGKKKKRATL